MAVGAPLEEMGAGALYIYLGGPNGPTNKHSQKILGHEFTPPLSSFGSHISKPISAISSYGYPGTALFCFGSDIFPPPSRIWSLLGSHMSSVYRFGGSRL